MDRTSHPFFKNMAKKFFIPLRNILNQILELDVDAIALEIAKTREFKTLVIALNTEGLPTSQLYELGQDSLGKGLRGKTILKDGEYTPFTVQKKQEKGQRVDHPTLKDTGGFYMSFNVIPFKGGFEIVANGEVGDKNLFEELGEDIIGLNPVNLQIVREFYRNAILQKVNNILKVA